MEVTETTVEEHFKNITLLIDKCFNFISCVSIYKPVGWVAEVMPDFIKEALEEQSRVPERRTNNLIRMQSTVKDLMEKIGSDEKFKKLEERIKELELCIETKEEESRELSVQLKLKEFKIKQLDQRNLNYQKEILTNFQDFTSGIKQMANKIGLKELRKNEATGIANTISNR